MREALVVDALDEGEDPGHVDLRVVVQRQVAAVRAVQVACVLHQGSQPPQVPGIHGVVTHASRGVAQPRPLFTDDRARAGPGYRRVLGFGSTAHMAPWLVRQGKLERCTDARRLSHCKSVSVGEPCKDAAGNASRRDGDILKPIGKSGPDDPDACRLEVSGLDVKSN